MHWPEAVLLRAQLMAKTAWGIETGASTLKAVKLTYDGKGNVTIDDYVAISMAPYRTSGADDNLALLAAMRDLVLQKGIKSTETAFVSLAGRHAFSRIITLPPVGEDSIRETIANEARGQIPIKLEEAVWDYQRISSEPGEALVNLYAVKRDVAVGLMSACKNAGLPVKGIQLAPLGIYNFIKFEHEQSLTNSCVCLDIGADNTDLLIVDGEKTWIRVIPNGGNDVTKALLRKDKRLTPQMAESLKRDPMGTVKKLNDGKVDPIWKDVGSVFEVMKEPLRNMVADISRSVGFYKSQNEGANFNQLVLMGNGSRLINMTKFLEQQLQFSVYRVDQLTKVAPGRSVDPAELQSIAHTLAVPIGMALQAVGVKDIATTNLVPREMVAEEQAAKARPLAVIGGAAMLIAGATTLFMAMNESGKVEDEVNRIRGLNSQASARIGERGSLLDGDVYRAGYSMTMDNLFRGHDLAVVTQSLLAQTVDDYRQMPGVQPLIYINNPASTNRPGLMVTEESGVLAPKPPTGEGAFVPEDIGPGFLARTTKVLGTASIGIPVHFSGVVDDPNGAGPTQPKEEEVAAASRTADALKDMLARRIRLILRPGPAAGDSAWEADVRTEFGSNPEMLEVAKAIRKQVGPMEEQEADRLVSLSGNLRARGGILESSNILAPGADIQSISLVGLVASQRPWIARKYFHMQLELQLEGKPVGGEEPKPTDSPEGTQVQ